LLIGAEDRQDPLHVINQLHDDAISSELYLHRRDVNGAAPQPGLIPIPVPVKNKIPRSPSPPAGRFFPRTRPRRVYGDPMGKNPRRSVVAGGSQAALQQPAGGPWARGRLAVSSASPPGSRQQQGAPAPEQAAQ
jgi:hypothetical protein